MRHDWREHRTDPVFRALVVPVDAQIHGQLHAHNLHELVVVRSGSGMHELGGRDWPIAAGEVFIIPPGIPHRYRQPRRLSLINLLVQSPASWLPVRDLEREPGWRALFVDAPGDRPGGRMRLQPQEMIESCRRCQRIADELHLARPGWRGVAAGELVGLLTDLVRWWPLRGEDALDPRAAALRAFLDAEHHRPLGVPEMARQLGATVRSVQRLCRRTFSCSPLELLEGIRLEHAALLLVDDRLDVATVAARAGFADPSYFARRWRRRHGEPPRGRR